MLHEVWLQRKEDLSTRERCVIMKTETETGKKSEIEIEMIEKRGQRGEVLYTECLYSPQIYMLKC